MAVWGSYESGKELAQSGVGVLWAARPAGATDAEERFVIKTNEGLLFLGDAEQTERGSALFLESAKAQKALTDAGVPGWARILECGKTDAGAFYVADRYERSVQKVVVRGIKVGGAGLRQVVLGIVDALIVLRARANRPHGNLKTTNVLIGGPDGPTVDRDPVVLTDLKPASTLSPKDAEEDVRAIGRLVYEMVMLRPPRDSVGLTVSMTSDWSRLGGAALAWIDFVNRLLDVTPGRALPDLVELREMIPSTGMAATSGRRLPLLAVGSVLALLIAGGGTYYFVTKGKGGQEIPPPPPPPVGTMTEAEWTALLTFIDNVLSRREAFAKALQSDGDLWNQVPPEVRSILSDPSVEMPWKYFPPPGDDPQKWGDPVSTLRKPPYTPPSWNDLESQAGASKYVGWRNKADDLKKRSESFVKWTNALVPAEPNAEWNTEAWKALGWSDQLDSLVRWQGVTSVKMDKLKFASESELANAVRFSLQGKKIGDAAKGLIESMKPLEASDDAALKQFARAVQEYTKDADTKALIEKAGLAQKFAGVVKDKLDDKTGWDRTAFAARFKKDYGERIDGQKLAYADFKMWLSMANYDEYKLNQQLTDQYHAQSQAAAKYAGTGLANIDEAIKETSGKRMDRIKQKLEQEIKGDAAVALAQSRIDVEGLKKALATAKDDGEKLAKEPVFESNKNDIQARLKTVVALAELAKVTIPSDFANKTTLVQSFTQRASALTPGFKDAFLRQIDAVSKVENPNLGDAQTLLEEKWLANLKALSDEAVKAMPDKFVGEPGVDLSKFDPILTAKRDAALKDIGESIKDKPPGDDEIKGVAQSKAVTEYKEFKQSLEGIIKNVALSSALMKSGDLKTDDKEGKAAAQSASTPAFKALFEDKSKPLAAWKADYDEVVKLRAKLAAPSDATFDAAADVVRVSPPPVLNRVLLAWKIVVKIDAKDSPLDKSRLNSLNQMAGEVIASIDPKLASADVLKADIEADKKEIWLNFMSRVPDINDEERRFQALLAGRALMGSMGFKDAGPSDSRLAEMPGTLYNLALLKLKEEAAKLTADPVADEKDETLKAKARQNDADKVKQLLTQLQAVAKKDVAPIQEVAGGLLDTLAKASVPSTKPAFAPKQSGPMLPQVKNMAWKLVSDEASTDTVVYEWQGQTHTHTLAFRKLDVPGQKEPTYLCTREVSLGLFMDVAQATELLEHAVLSSSKGLTQYFPEEEADPGKIGPRVWNPKPAGAGIIRAEGTSANLFGWYRLPDTHRNPKNFPGGIPFLPPGSTVKVAPPSLDLPIQYITPATAILVAHRMGCRLPTRADFEKAASGPELAAPNLRDKTWKEVFNQMLSVKASKAWTADPQAKLEPCFPQTGMFKPFTMVSIEADSSSYDSDDGTLFFRSAEPTASGTEAGFSDLFGNVAELVIDTDQDSGPLAVSVGQSLASDTASSQDAIKGKVFVVGGSALSPPPGPDKAKSYDNKTPYLYPTGSQNASRGFSDVGFRLAFSAAGGGGSPIDGVKNAIATAKFARVK